MKNLTKNELQLIVQVYRTYFTYPDNVDNKLSDYDLDRIYNILTGMTYQPTGEIENDNN